MPIGGIPPILFQSRPLPPDVLPPGFALAVFAALVLSRVVGGPLGYFLARTRAPGREVWWGFFATAVPLFGLVLLFVLHGPKAAPATGSWNPWVLCPFCRTPRGYSQLPCPLCGQLLPVLPGYAPPPTAPPASPSRAREIRGGQVVGALFFAILLANLAVILLILPVLADPAITEVQVRGLSTAAWFILLGLVVQDSILTAVAFDQAVFRGRLTWQEMGLFLKRAPFSVPRQVGLGVGAGAFTFLMSSTALLIFLKALSLAGLGDLGTSTSPTQPRIQSLSDYEFWLVAGVIVAPFAEEVFFRGYALGGFAKRRDINRGLVITSLLFAAIHLDPIAFVPLCAAGLVLGTLYLETGSLLAPIAAHATNNFIAMTLTYFGF